MTEQLRRIERALLSVSDKTGLIDFARALAEQGVELISTGGTAKTIADAGIRVIGMKRFPESVIISAMASLPIRARASPSFAGMRSSIAGFGSEITCR